MPPFERPIVVIYLEPSRSDHLRTLKNRHFCCPRWTKHIEIGLPKADGLTTPLYDVSMPGLFSHRLRRCGSTRLLFVCAERWRKSSIQIFAEQNTGSARGEKGLWDIFAHDHSHSTCTYLLPLLPERISQLV